MNISKYSMSSRLHVYLEAAGRAEKDTCGDFGSNISSFLLLFQSQCAETPSGLRWRVKVSRTKNNTLPLSVYSVQRGSRLLSFCQSSGWHWSITGREGEGSLGVFPLLQKIVSMYTPKLGGLLYSYFILKRQRPSLWAGFEPTQGIPIGFQVQRLNHSAITATRQAITFLLHVWL